jgi:excisionase family DNA binding protein
MVQLLTDSEASELLRLTPRQVLRLAKRGEIPAVHLPGGEIRFDPDDISRWVQAQKRPGVNVAGQQAALPAVESPIAAEEAQ